MKNIDMFSEEYDLWNVCIYKQKEGGYVSLESMAWMYEAQQRMCRMCRFSGRCSTRTEYSNRSENESI